MKKRKRRTILPPGWESVKAFKKLGNCLNCGKRFEAINPARKYCDICKQNACYLNGKRK